VCTCQRTSIPKRELFLIHGVPDIHNRTVVRTIDPCPSSLVAPSPFQRPRTPVFFFCLAAGIDLSYLFF